MHGTHRKGFSYHHITQINIADWHNADTLRKKDNLIRRETLERNMSKTIITVVGKDTVGIIAKVCTYLAENNINIEDISQTIIQGYFNMMMIVDTSSSKAQFSEMVTELEKIGEGLGVKIKCQHEEIFTKMHRI